MTFQYCKYIAFLQQEPLSKQIRHALLGYFSVDKQPNTLLDYCGIFNHGSNKIIIVTMAISTM